MGLQRWLHAGAGLRTSKSETQRNEEARAAEALTALTCPSEVRSCWLAAIAGAARTLPVGPCTSAAGSQPQDVPVIRKGCEPRVRSEANAEDLEFAEVLQEAKKLI